MRMNTRGRNVSFVLVWCLILISFIQGCTGNKDTLFKQGQNKININIGVLKGPTGLGTLKLMEDSELNKAYSSYKFTVAGDPNEIVGKVSAGELDMAFLPVNVSAMLYNKSNSNIKMLALNTLGVIYILADENQGINSVADLKGKTIYATAPGATPEYALNHILSLNGLEPGKDVKIEYLSEHSELAAKMIAGDIKIGMLPEPFVTQVTAKKSNIAVALDLTKEWDKAVNSESILTMGCVIGRKDFIQKHKDVIDNFLSELKTSVNYVNNNVNEASILSQKYDIMPADVTVKAIPNCNIVYIDSSEMQNKCSNFLNVLYKAEPKSVGGSLPGEDFYYKG